MLAKVSFIELKIPFNIKKNQFFKKINSCKGAYSVDCGAFCAINQSKCAQTLIEMGTTAVEIVIQITKLNPIKVLQTLNESQKSLGIQLCTSQMYQMTTTAPVDYDDNKTIA